jgi:hypothetical protein
MLAIHSANSVWGGNPCLAVGTCGALWGSALLGIHHKDHRQIHLGAECLRAHVVAVNLKHHVLQLGIEVAPWNMTMIISHDIIMAQCESHNCFLVGPIEMANSLVGQSLKAVHQGVYRGTTLVQP